LWSDFLLGLLLHRLLGTLAGSRGDAPGALAEQLHLARERSSLGLPNSLASIISPCEDVALRRRRVDQLGRLAARASARARPASGRAPAGPLNCGAIVAGAVGPPGYALAAGIVDHGGERRLGPSGIYFPAGSERPDSLR